MSPSPTSPYVTSPTPTSGWSLAANGATTHQVSHLNSAPDLYTAKMCQGSRSAPFVADNGCGATQQPRYEQQPMMQNAQSNGTAQHLQLRNHNNNGGRNQNNKGNKNYKNKKQNKKYTNNNNNKYGTNNSSNNNNNKQQTRYNNNNARRQNQNQNQNQKQNQNQNSGDNHHHRNGYRVPKNVDSECVKRLIQTIRDQSAEMLCMQKTISHLKQKMETARLLEEDFFSFLSRIEFPAWVSDEQRKHCLNKLFVNEMKKVTVEVEAAKLQRRTAASQNLTLETKVIELNDELTTSRDALDDEKHKNYLESVNHNKTLAEKLAKMGQANGGNGGGLRNGAYRNGGTPSSPRGSIGGAAAAAEYPPENITIQNLIRTQIEYYFSDYNLKRDKRLLDQLCSDRIGFLKIDSVMNLTRVRQLSSHRNQVINSLKSSKFLTLTSDNEWVGRLGFERPQEKQFPFRRTVFVFGLPMACDEKYVTEMLSPFGKLSKVLFDHGPDTLDRLVAQKMFEETRVYKYRDLSSKISYQYQQEIMVGGSSDFTCRKCNKVKPCDEGFYESNSYELLVCLQCAAAAAETIAEKCKNTACNPRMIELMCGKSPRDTAKTKTALAVFTSQRQASKCVYVRSRIAFDGTFCTHYHHYSKLKKDIALTLRPYADKLKEIPPRRVLEICGASPSSVDMATTSVYHLSTKPLGSYSGDADNHRNGNGNGDDGVFKLLDVDTLSTLSLSDQDSGSRKGTDSLSVFAFGGPLAPLCDHASSSLPNPDVSVPEHSKVMKMHRMSKPSKSVEDVEDCKEDAAMRAALSDTVDDVLRMHDHQMMLPKLTKSSDGSSTAPVVGGSGGLYLMRAAYDKVNSTSKQ